MIDVAAELRERIPAAIHVLPLDKAQALYDAHMRACPGTYLECAVSGKLNERAEWVLGLVDVETKLRLAKAYHNSPKALPAMHPHRRSSQSASRKTSAQYLQNVNDSLNLMAASVPGSLDWRRARAAAYNFGLAARRRAQEDGEPAPDIPHIPETPMERRGALIREPHPDPKIQARRERDRARKANKRSE